MYYGNLESHKKYIELKHLLFDKVSEMISWHRNRANPGVEKYSLYVSGGGCDASHKTYLSNTSRHAVILWFPHSASAPCEINCTELRLTAAVQKLPEYINCMAAWDEFVIEYDAQIVYETLVG